MTLEQAKQEIAALKQPVTRSGAHKAANMIEETAIEDAAKLGRSWQRDLNERAAWIRKWATELPNGN